MGNISLIDNGFLLTESQNSPKHVACLQVWDLPEGPALYPEDYLTDQPERFFVAEMVRERILHHTRQEIPYASGVVIESFKEEEGLVRIHAVIYVERDSQKGILIGRGGSMLKTIGTEARRQIDRLGTRVHPCLTDVHYAERANIAALVSRLERTVIVADADAGDRGAHDADDAGGDHQHTGQPVYRNGTSQGS